MRAVVGARVSVVKGLEKVSHYAQHDSGIKWAHEQGHTIAGTFQDLDVSATVSPWERDDLGPWLKERAHEWEIMIFSKIDRAFRSISDCVKLAEWMQENRKILVFADDNLVLDYNSEKKTRDMASMMAELFVMLGSFFAQIELERFRGRSLDAHAVLRTQDRWTGGTAPEGFKIIPHPSGRGKGLATDSYRKAMVHEIGKKFINGSSYNAIAIWLNEQGYMTNRDYQRKPENRTGIKWSLNEVIKILTSPATQGMKTTGKGNKKEPVLDDSGEPIQMAPPTFDADTWKQIQLTVAQRKREPYRSHGVSPLYRAIFCGKCGRVMSQNVHVRDGKTWKYYRCTALPKACPMIRIRAADAEQILEEEFQKRAAHLPTKKRVFVPGEDHTEELEKLRVKMKRLRDNEEAGYYDGEEEEYHEKMDALASRRKELEALPQRPSGWVFQETGETYGQAWKQRQNDPEGRRKLLVDSGIYLQVNGKNNTHVFIPEDVAGKLEEAS